jgi:hypothetical protein
MSAVRIAAAMLLVLASTASSAAGLCPTYAGRAWEFTGHLVNQISPGPPDFKSVSSGDEPITRWYLQLSWPACFAEHKRLTRFQLALKPEDAERCRQYLGQEIRVEGTLEEGAPGQFTTALAMNVSGLARYTREWKKSWH